MNTIGDVREMDDGLEQATPAPERLVLDEKKRSPSKKEWSAPQGRATTFYEESIYLAQSSNVNLNLFMVFNSFM